ncbi:glutamine synthetase family protein [Actinosynnema sp. NPDC047251]|uniref:Glutamine synthetase n=1 Tax=Saccharothrix espanaensis (strain ATCC 51144 / DSM 44229 / JCM 9112 / NBRC 15066 / NRRL 15764) TaxID=1179773 RepID=K0KC44_SACES|nr:glutamine synthetase family protein [Saccharothrix espanaensis]CCH34168.1 Glutamine synthetase [Saccharothrix espanaensis DSM 44229]
MDTAERDHRQAQATALLDGLADRDVVAVAITWVDHSGITRVKTVPLDKLPRAAAHGVGTSPSFDAFLLDDTIVAGRYAGGPVGDLRLHPDLARITVLAGQPGWAWAPADRYDQQGEPHPQDERGLARTMADRLAVNGFEVRAGFEVEWVVGQGGTDDFRPATTAPAYGHTRQVELSDYCADLISALVEQNVDVLQFHPEYAAGQFEVSTAPEDPVHAADTAVLVRETIRAITIRHGLRASFSPKVVSDGVGNGGHLHVSLWRERKNLFEGRLHPDAEGFAAGVLRHLPGLCAIGCPSVASYLRLIPSHWAGAFATWGVENREAALRLVENRDLEIKCFDLSANPYLVVAATLAAGLAGIVDGAHLPPPVTVDPVHVEGAQRLPTSLEDAVKAFEDDEVLTEAFGVEFAATIADVRRGEIAKFADASSEEITHATRWRH